MSSRDLPPDEPTANPARVYPCERLIAWFHLTLALLLVIAGEHVPGQWLLAALFCAIASSMWALERGLAQTPAPKATLVRGFLALVGVPWTFTELGWLLPMIHPEPFEWRMLEQDRWLLGGDAWQLLAPWSSPWLGELLQWVYASFYFLPVAIGVALGCQRRWLQMEAVVAVFVLGFYLSYLGYFLWPAMAPYQFFSHEAPLEHLWLGAQVHGLLHDLENVRQDCVPSGHVMMSLMAVFLAWHLKLRLFWWLLPVVSLLCFGTVYLRYHWVVDVLYGAALAGPALALGRRWLGPRRTAEQKPVAGLGR
jgi:membrane-associated phospholipid phosphatase